MFLFSDNQIKNEGFVEDINNILNSGEVPGYEDPYLDAGRCGVGSTSRT